MKAFIFFGILLLIIGCKEVTEQQNPIVESYPMKEVMAVHDELMPKMGTIVQLQQKLKDTAIVGHKQAYEDLKTANDAMMLWMENLADDFETDELLSRKQLSEEKLQVLDTYTESVEALKVQMETAILNAQRISKDTIK